MQIQLYPKTRRGLIRFAIMWGGFLIFMLGFGGCMIIMPGHTHKGPLAPLTAGETAIRDRLKAHVTRLAGEIGRRSVPQHPKELEAAAQYIHATLEASGYKVGEQAFEAQGHTVRNLEVELPGTSKACEIIVVGAHYDSVPSTPGADDNASGVAGMLELARLLAGRPLGRTIRLVAFVNEEPPFFYSDEMGSLVYARRSAGRREKITAMLALEMIGYYSDAPGSQHYPFPFSLCYPSRGNFIGFVGNVASRALVRQVTGSFRRHAAFPAEGVAAPGKIVGIGWSDHWAFWQAGYPALMVTDTAMFRNARYHGPQDTPETLDYDRMARVVAGLERVVEELAGQ